MTYKQLKKIATPHIREGSNLPSNSFLLLNQLHIPFKNDKQCRDDFKGKYNPLYEHPAFLLTEPNGDKTVYFNSNTMYWNFYIFHEIAHYLLGHEMSSPQNEIDADMLACILAAPIENLPTYLKTARDLSSLCQIPIDKAEMYWQEIFPITKQIDCKEDNTHVMLELIETIAELKSELESTTEKIQMMCRMLNLRMSNEQAGEKEII